MAEYIVDARPSDLFGIKMTGLLVRCKDCKHFTQTIFDNDGFGYCHNGMGWKETTTDWYCAGGERENN